MSASEHAPVGVRAPVRVVDIPIHRVRRPADLVLMLVSLIGIGAVFILGVYASRTTTGVIDDIEASPLQGLIEVVSNILLLPINVIEGWLTLILPIVVIVERLIRRNPRAVIEALAAATVAGALALFASWLIIDFAPTALRNELRVWQLDLEGLGQWVVTITPTVAALAALLTATGTRDRSRVVTISWNLLWIVLVVSVITATSTIIGALVSVLIGRSVGLGMRYLSGVLSERAHGEALVNAIRRAGVDPVSVVRMSSVSNVAHMRIDTVTPEGPVGYATTHAEATEWPGGPSDDAGVLDAHKVPTTGLTSGEAPEASAAVEPQSDTAIRGIAAVMPESATVAIEREGLNRIYAVTDRQGNRWDAVVLDRDRQVIGMLAWLWSAIQLRGFGRRNAVSLRQAADRAALMTYAAAAAGVESPQLHGLARADDSIVLLGEHVDGAQNLSDYPVDRVTDEVMDRAWAELAKAHHAGLSHRSLSAETVLLVGDGDRRDDVLINGWEQGDIASSTVSRRLDVIQMLVLFAVRVGAERACAAAARSLGHDELGALAPLLQTVALPPETRLEVRREKNAMRDVRNKLVTYLPSTETEVQPFQLTRFQPRTIITIIVAVAAGWVLLTAVNFREILGYAANAEPLWLLAAFGLGMLTYLGSALGLVAFSPDKLGLWRTILVQIASSVVAIVAPAGVGPAALNLRFMQKRGVQTPMALATVALLQVSQFVTTVLLLVAIALLTGSQGALASLPSGTIGVILLIALALIGVLFAIPQLRRWALVRIRPTVKQVMPRFVWVLGQPARLLMGIGGNIVMTAGFLAAFAATLAAFGQSLPLTTLAVIYLTGTAVGSAIPTPGGIGGVEAALTTGLGTAGIATAAALPTVLVFRVLTLWLRVPLGWFALRHLQKHNAV